MKLEARWSGIYLNQMLIKRYKSSELRWVLHKSRIFAKLLGKKYLRDAIIYNEFIILQYNSQIEIFKIGKKNKYNPLNFTYKRSWKKKISTLHLTVAKINGRDTLLMGDYVRNDQKLSVFVYKLNLENNLLTKFKIPDGLINHIHMVKYDRFANKFLILTGDFGEKIGIYSLNKEFNQLTSVYINGQNSRIAWISITSDKYYFATDSHLQKNSFNIVYKKGFEIQSKIHMPGSSIYYLDCKDKIYFSTCVEPKYKKKRSKLDVFSRKYASDTNCYHLFCFDKKLESLTEIDKKQKNIIPAGISGFGTFMFLSDDSQTNLVVRCQG